MKMKAVLLFCQQELPSMFGIMALLACPPIHTYAQTRIYVADRDWVVTVIDAKSNAIVESIDIRKSLPQLDASEHSTPALFVPERNIMFAGRTPEFDKDTVTDLRVVKLDLETGVATPFFLNPFHPYSLSMEEPTGLYFDPLTARLLASFVHGEATDVYWLNLDGSISSELHNSDINVELDLPRRGATVGRKLYSLFSPVTPPGCIFETDVTTLQSRIVLDSLQTVSYNSLEGNNAGSMKILFWLGNHAQILVADSGALCYYVRTDSVGQWAIDSTEPYQYMVDGTADGDVAGDKSFAGNFLTVEDSATFSIFDFSRNPMPLVHRISLPPAEYAWNLVPEEDRGPYAYKGRGHLLPGTNIIAELYFSGPRTSTLLLLLNSITGSIINKFLLGSLQEDALQIYSGGQSWNTLQVPGQYTTIQSAITASHSGDVILVDAGVYNEYAKVVGKQDLIIMARDTTAQVRVQGVQVSGSNVVTIKGFTIDAAGTSKPAVLLQGGTNKNTDVAIEACEIKNAGKNYPGIDVEDGNTRTRIVNNRIHSNGRDGIALSNLTAGRTYVVNNTIVRNGLNGVSISGQDTSYLVNNIISFNGTRADTTAAKYGLWYGGTSPQNITLLNNLLVGNNGTVTGTSSRDLGGFNNILDSTDSGNLTTEGTEGAGVTVSASSSFARYLCLQVRSTCT